MKQILLIAIHHQPFDITDPQHERECVSTWKALRAGLAGHGSRCDYDEGNQEMRACFLIDKLTFVNLLAKLPPIPPEIALAVYTLASPADQFIEIDGYDQAMEPVNYHLSLK